MSDKPMTLLLIEDNIYDCNNFRACEKSRTDIKFVGITDSDIEAIEYVKNYMPEGIILDLELHKGKGSGTGFDFLQKLKDIKLSIKPKIVITTNVYSESVYDYVHENGADLIFYKKQASYSAENVINNLIILRGLRLNRDITSVNVQTPAERKDMISNKINSELDLIGVGSHLQGRKYLHDAIFYLLSEEDNRVTVIQYLVNKYKRSNSTISRAMQNAILHAWRISSLEDLMVHYTARINYETGVPTPTEFMYYYADKINKII